MPFEEQQLAALDSDFGLDLEEAELDDLVTRIRSALVETGKEPAGA